MENKDKIELLKHISVIHRTQFDERRRYEFKILFASLTFYVLAIIYKIANKIQFSEYSQIILTAFIILAIVNFIYLFRIHFANDKNLKFAENAEQLMESLFENKQSEIKMLGYSQKWCCFLFSPRAINFWAQAITVSIFSLAAIFVFLK